MPVSVAGRGSASGREHRQEARRRAARFARPRPARALAQEADDDASRLLQLTKPLPDDVQVIAPVRLQTTEGLPSGISCKASGWGHTSETVSSRR